MPWRVPHRATGVPISTHTEPATRRGLEQQKVFESEGVDLSRVVIGHSGDTADLEYLEELLARGSYLGMDRFGLYGILSFEERVRTVVELCERGYVDKLVLSHDAACYNDWLLRDGAVRLDDLLPHLPGRAPRAPRRGPRRHRDQHHARRQPPPPVRRARRLLGRSTAEQVSLERWRDASSDTCSLGEASGELNEVARGRRQGGCRRSMRTRCCRPTRRSRSAWSRTRCPRHPGRLRSAPTRGAAQVGWRRGRPIRSASGSPRPRGSPSATTQARTPPRAAPACRARGHSAMARCE